MKSVLKSTVLCSVAAGTAIGVASCSKYEENSGLHLTSKTNRLVGKWEVDKIDGSSATSQGYINAIFEFDDDGDFAHSYSDDYGNWSYEGDWEWNNDKDEVKVEVKEDGYSYDLDLEVIKLTKEEFWFDLNGVEYECEKD